MRRAIRLLLWARAAMFWSVYTNSPCAAQRSLYLRRRLSTRMIAGQFRKTLGDHHEASDLQIFGIQWLCSWFRRCCRTSSAVAGVNPDGNRGQAS